MALVKKRKFNDDEFIYADNVGVDWEKLLESGNKIIA